MRGMGSELPLPFRGRPFAVREAVRSGIPRSQLRVQSLDSPFHGIRAPQGSSDSLAGKCRSLATRFRDDHAFSGITAARLWELPLPRWAESDPRLFISVAPKASTTRRPGIVCVQRPHFAQTTLRDGLPVLSPVDVWASLALVLPIDDLIAVGDAIVAQRPGRPGLAAVEDLRRRVEQGRGARGVRRLACAVDEVRTGAWSRPETLLRLAITRAGLPEPRLNFPVRLSDGRVAIADLAWPEYGVLVEYQGGYHAEARQWVRDLARLESLNDRSFLVVQVTASQLFGATAELISRLASRLSSRGWHGDRPVEPWKYATPVP